MKFDNVVGILLSEKVHMKSLGSAETSGSALGVDRRGRSWNRDKKKNGGRNLNRGEVQPSQEVQDVGGVVRYSIF